MRLLVLCAGTSSPSNAEALADAFLKGACVARSPLEVTKLRLRELRIDHFTLDFYDPVCTQEEDFCRVQELLLEADGVVIATPVWNFSVPAHLKNLIDRMGSFALDATRTRGTLAGKPFFLIVTMGAPRAAWMIQKHTIAHLPWSLQFFGGTIAGIHVEGGCVLGKGEFGLIVDKRLGSLRRAHQSGERFVQAIASGRVRHHGNLFFTFLLKVLKLRNAVARAMWGRG